MTETYKEAKERIPNQQERIIQALKEAGQNGCTNIELSKICLSLTARMSELYSKGYKIDVVLEGKGFYRYVLLAEPTQINAPKKALDVLVEKIGNKNVTTSELINLLDENGFNVVRRYGSYK